MELRVYNTLSGKKELFKPLLKDKVGMYVCGPTVYDHSHIGHARAYVCFDIIYRTLKEFGYRVTYVRNLTDIDDKIINKAQAEGLDFKQISRRYIASYQEDMRALNVQAPDLEPKASENIEEMIALIEQLLAKKMAYLADGDVYYSVPSFADYCCLSKRDKEQLQSGARVALEQKKKDPLDFVLWKKAKEGEPSWPSPFGPGRPGWHIECSAMSRKFLGETFDIHGGGMDLIFPHHENEIAQSEGANAKRLANYWLHNGFVQINKEKMSKSLGNTTTIKQLLKTVDSQALRLFLLSVHYHGPLDFSLEGVAESKRALERLYNALTLVKEKDPWTPPAKSEAGLAFSTKFKEALADDFNTAKALAVLFEMSKEINRLKENKQQLALDLAKTMRQLANDYLGLLEQPPANYFQEVSAGQSKITKDKIKEMIAARNQARQDKDFAKADQIRQALLEAGVVLEDGSKGTSWKWQK